MPTYERQGDEFLANTLLAGSQFEAQVFSSRDGGFIVIWIDQSGQTHDASMHGIRGQRFDAQGLKLGDEFGVNTTTFGTQYRQTGTALADGRFVVTWSDTKGDGNEVDVRGQIFNADGSKAGEEFLATTVTAKAQLNGGVVALAGGGFVVTWTDNSGQGGDTMGRGTKAQIFDGAGAKVGGEFLVNTVTAGHEFARAIAALPSGGFAVSFSSFDRVEFQIFDANGNKVGPQRPVNVPTDSLVLDVNIAVLASGFVVTWAEDSIPRSFPTPTYTIKAQLLNEAGEKVGGEILVDPTPTAWDKHGVVALPEGDGFMITWSGWVDPDSEDLTYHDIYSQVYGADGVAIGAVMPINGVTAGTQMQPKVAMLASGDIVVTWTDASQGSGDIKVQLLSRPEEPSGRVLMGSIGNDHLVGGTGDDGLYGLEGDDWLEGGDGVDYLDGGIGNDGLYGDNGADIVFGGVGDDGLHGGFGNDYLDGGEGRDYFDGGLGNDGLYGGAGDDVMFGRADDDGLYGGDGADYLNGEGGRDYLEGGLGNDGLYGGIGNDILFGGAGDDGLLGEDGDDYIDGGDGADYLDGDFGNDVLLGGAGADYMLGGYSDDHLEGGADADILFGEQRDDGLHGGDGNDYLNGGDDRDYLDGGTGNDGLYAGNGDDIAFGGIGDDGLYGEDGADYLDGGDGADYFDGGLGNDGLYGGLGNDIALGAGGDDGLHGGDGDDYLSGGEDVDYLDGGLGNDSLEGGAGDDIALGGMGADNLPGGDGNDYLNGGEGSDYLTGGSGNDSLDGGVGTDILTGGDGADAFLMMAAPGTNFVHLLDFTVGVDRIVFDDAAFGLPLGALSPDAFRTGAAAQDADDRIVYNPATGALIFDADGSGAGAAVQIASLQTGLPLAASDFSVL